MRFAVDIANHVSDTIGCRLMTLDALPSAISYYEKLGFIRNKLANKRSKKTDDKKTKPMATDISVPLVCGWTSTQRHSPTGCSAART